MGDWQTVRCDPDYPEPLDAEIIPLCDALNRAGFVTTASCCGHGERHPAVWFEHSNDARIESMARFVMASEQGDFRSHYSGFDKTIELDGYSWVLHVRVSEVYADTPTDVALAKAVAAISAAASAVDRWHTEKRFGRSFQPG